MNNTKKYFQPNTLIEAASILNEYKDKAKIIAGGTDVYPNKFLGIDNENVLVDITNIKELKEIKCNENFLHIGSLVKLKELKKNTAIIKEFNAVIESAELVGSPLIRNSATIGGNLLCENRCIFFNQSEFWREAAGYCLKCNGDICIATGGKKACFSKFVSDLAPALISMNAQIILFDGKNYQQKKLKEIYTGDGVNPRNISPSSVLTEILLPVNQNFKSVIKKLRHRKSLEFTSLTTAVTIDKSSNLKIVIGGAAQKPLVFEFDLQSKGADLIKNVVKKIRIVDNDMYSRQYRIEILKNYLHQSFKELSID